MPEAAAMFSRDKDAFITALQQSDLKLRERVFYRVAYLRPGVREQVVEYIAAIAADEGGDVRTMGFEDLIKLILDNLPAIIEFIKLFF